MSLFGEALGDEISSALAEAEIKLKMKIKKRLSACSCRQHFVLFAFSRDRGVIRWLERPLTQDHPSNPLALRLIVSGLAGGIGASWPLALGLQVRDLSAATPSENEQISM